MKSFEFAAKRKRLDVTQREIEKRFALPAGSLGGIEDGRLRLVEDQINEFDAFLDEVERTRRRNEEVMAA